MILGDWANDPIFAASMRELPGPAMGAQEVTVMFADLLDDLSDAYLIPFYSVDALHRSLPTPRCADRVPFLLHELRALTQFWISSGIIVWMCMI